MNGRSADSAEDRALGTSNGRVAMKDERRDGVD